MDAELKLSSAEQKQLSSKFNHKLKAAPENVLALVEEAKKLPPGQKQAAHQAVVKAWIIDKTWGNRFLNVVRTVSFVQQLKQRQRPVTWKQLESKWPAKFAHKTCLSGSVVRIMCICFKCVHINLAGTPLRSLMHCSMMGRSQSADIPVCLQW